MKSVGKGGGGGTIGELIHTVQSSRNNYLPSPFCKAISTLVELAYMQRVTLRQTAYIYKATRSKNDSHKSNINVFIEV